MHAHSIHTSARSAAAAAAAGGRPHYTDGRSAAAMGEVSVCGARVCAVATTCVGGSGEW